MREDGTHIYVAKQWLSDLKVDETKNGKVGNVFIIPECRDALKEWFSVSMEVKREMRLKEAPGEAFKLACIKNYAKHMLERGATLEDLRSWLRDSMKTIEDYYANWVQRSSQMQQNVRRFG